MKPSQQVQLGFENPFTWSRKPQNEPSSEARILGFKSKQKPIRPRPKATRTLRMEVACCGMDMQGRLRPTNPICTFGGPEGRFQIKNTARDALAIIPTGLLRNDDSRRYFDLDSGNLDQDDECFETQKANISVSIGSIWRSSNILNQQNFWKKAAHCAGKASNQWDSKKKGTFSRSSS